MRGGFRRLTVAGVAALALVAAPADAAKKGKKPAKLKTRSAIAVTDITADARPVPICPKGTIAVAGGFATRAPLFAASLRHLLVIYVNSPSPFRNEWQIAGRELFGTIRESVTGYAYCERFRGRIRLVSEDTTLTAVPRGATTVAATCPKGTRVLSGGWVMEAPRAFDAGIVTRSMRTGARNWTVEATRISGTDPKILISQAICGKDENAKSAKRFATAQVGGPIDSTFTATTPSCRKRTPARAGGFATPPLSEGLLNAALVYEHYRLGRAWTTSAAASSNTTAASISSIAYCRR
jgi:hypothetical protein